MQQKIQKILLPILDTLFPIFCLSCGAHGEWLCATCRGLIPLRREHHCPLCLRQITPFGRTCFDCSDRRHALDGLFIASHYRIPIISHAIHTYKYRFVSSISASLGTFLADAVRQTDLPLPDRIVPVPLHRRRLRFRGFNQSALLAETLSRTLVPGLDIPVLADTLLRTRYTKPQMKTESRDERLRNLKNAFALAPGAKKTVKGKNIWLIDDVATTGTTLEECARVLKRAGARQVFGIVLAR